MRPRAWGGAGFRTHTVGEFREALQSAAREKRFVLIEAVVHSIDPVFNSAVQNAINGGLTYVIPAGNYQADACGVSPAAVTDGIAKSVVLLYAVELLSEGATARTAPRVAVGVIFAAVALRGLLTLIS